MQLSEHFSLEEATRSSTALRCGIDNTPSEEQRMNIIEAAEHLEKVRDVLGKPILIDSWLRVRALNAAVNGARTSAHVNGWAIDFTCPDYTPLEICKKIIDSGIKFDQLIEEGTWVHISFAPTMRHEVLTASFVNGQKVTYSHGIKDVNQRKHDKEIA